MTNKQIEDLLADLTQRSFETHCRYVALVQMLIDRKIIKGKDQKILEELELRAADIKREDLNEAWVRQRARKLREAWSKLPTQ
jgi:hypothetical protein